MKGTDFLDLSHLVYALCITSLTILVTLAFVLARRQRRYQRLRQELMQWQMLHPNGEPSTIAPLAQPQPNRVAAIALPTAFRLRTRWTRLLVPAICVFGAFDLVLLLPLYGSGGWYQVAVVLGFLDVIILLPLFSVFPFWVIPQQMTVTEEGISVIQEGKPPIKMAWSEMKLFAVAPDGHAEDEPLYYELSSTRKTIRLLRVRRRMRWFLFPWENDRAVKPATSFEVYEAQMEALLDLIAAKTGLPLYDLRAV